MARAQRTLRRRTRGAGASAGGSIRGGCAPRLASLSLSLRWVISRCTRALVARARRRLGAGPPREKAPGSLTARGEACGAKRSRRVQRRAAGSPVTCCACTLVARAARVRARAARPSPTPPALLEDALEPPRHRSVGRQRDGRRRARRAARGAALRRHTHGRSAPSSVARASRPASSRHPALERKEVLGRRGPASSCERNRGKARDKTELRQQRRDPRPPRGLTRSRASRQLTRTVRGLWDQPNHLGVFEAYEL